MKKNWDVYQQWYCLLGQEGETAPGAFFFAVLVNWSGCCFCFPSSIHFSQGHCSVWACVGQQKGRKKTKLVLDQQKERQASVSPNLTVWLMTTRGFFAQSVTPHAGSAGHRKVSGVWEQREQDGGQVKPAFSSRLTLTHTVTQANLFVCLSEGRWKPGLWA